MRFKALWMGLMLVLGIASSEIWAAEIRTARGLAAEALQEVSAFTKQLDGLGRKASVMNNSCRNARALIARKRANLNGLAMQVIEKAIEQKEAVVVLFPDLLDFLPVIDTRIQSTSEEIAELTQEARINPFRANLILDKLEQARAVLPLMEGNIQSLSDKLGDDLMQTFEDALAALGEDDSSTAREAMNQCLAVLREFEKLRKVVGQAQRGRVARLISESLLLMRSVGPLNTDLTALEERPFVALESSVAAIELRIYSADGRLEIRQTRVGNQLSWRELGQATEPLSNGVYLAVIGVRDSDGRLLRTELKKFAIRK